jgi:hypothetical protein
MLRATMKRMAEPGTRSRAGDAPVKRASVEKPGSC